MDTKLEELEDTRANLVIQYKLEKELQLKAKKNINYINDRADENKSLYILGGKNLEKVNNDFVNIQHHYEGNTDVLEKNRKSGLLKR